MKSDQEKIVVTYALPYANGQLHLGHSLGFIETDIFIRSLKLFRKEALFICASDMHGTPIEVKAKEAGIDPEKFAEQFSKSQQSDLKDLLVEFDNFHKTHSKENKGLAELFFKTLKEKKLIYLKETEQMYDSQANQFLPDRFVKGTCPKCGGEDQYGDACEKCGATYNPTELKTPYSVLTKTKPILKKSTHYYFKLKEMSPKITSWLKNDKTIQPEIRNFIEGWLKEGLQDWCISRDAPYFGFEIPESKKEAGAIKYFYVWLDAPIGYISSTKNYCDKQSGKKKSSWEDYWMNGSVYHFIGKDIIYFHYLFWPAMLMAMNIPVPKITTHGFITVNGQKMSKSRGTFFTLKDFLSIYSAESLRFYYANHLDRKVVDIDFNFSDFQAVTNNVLVANIGNFCYRTLVFANKNYGKITQVTEEKSLQRKIEKHLKSIKEHYSNQNFKDAVKLILQIADEGNSYFQKAEPWKNPEMKQDEVGFCVNLARTLSIILQPILPSFSEKVQGSLSGKSKKSLYWDDIVFNWKGTVKKPELLMSKVEVPLETPVFPLLIKSGKIVEVKDHPNADSLYVMTVDIGNEKRQVVAGLKKHFTVKELVGKKALFLVNLKKAKIRGEMSEAMTLVAEDKDHKITLLEVDSNLGSNACFEEMNPPELSSEVSFEDFVKIKMAVKDGRVNFDGKNLQVDGRDVVVKVKDGSKIC
ncbi:MAG: methionine--tRNA ligase [archaeon]|nr:methionine--tRNA ligase [archaeon]